VDGNPAKKNSIIKKYYQCMMVCKNKVEERWKPLQVAKGTSVVKKDPSETAKKKKEAALLSRKKEVSFQKSTGH
jgi:hypothetical protein